MTLFSSLAATTLALTILYVLTSAVRGGNLRIPWIIPALLFVAFFAFSAVTVLQEGLLGFWPMHTVSFWGLQIWMDLLFSVAIAWTFLVPEAKRLGMSVLPWGIFVACTASIGLWAMMARVLWLQEQAGDTHTA